MMKKLTLIFIVLFVSNANGFEIRSVSSHGLGNSFGFSSTDVVGIVNTGFHFDTTEFGIELGMFRNYALEELNEYYFASYYRKDKFTFGLGFIQMGDPDLYTEKNMKLSFSYRLNNFLFGVNGSYQKHEFDDNYESLSAEEFGFSAAYMNKYFIVGTVFDNLNGSKLSESSIPTQQKQNIYLEIRSQTRYQTFVIYDIYKYYENRIGIGERITFTDDFYLLAGFETKPSVLSGGVEINLSQSKIIYTVSHHPALGMSHAVAFRFLK